MPPVCFQFGHSPSQLAKPFYRLVTKGEAYRRTSAEEDEAKQKEKQVKALEREARELGMQVVPIPA